MTGARPKVVIVGAGFGGLWAARALSRGPADVVLVDRNNYHTFFPLLYQVAAAELVPTDIAYPVRSIFRGALNVEVRMAEVVGVDSAARRVDTSEGPLDYDHLVLAMGSVPHYFGVEGAAEHSFPLRWMDDAIPLRHHILTRFEKAHQRCALRLAILVRFDLPEHVLETTAFEDPENVGRGYTVIVHRCDPLNQPVKHAVFRRIRIEKIADDGWAGLAMPVHSAVSLLEAIRIPGKLEVIDAAALVLKIQTLAGRIGR